MLANRARKVTADSGLRLQVLFCDGLAFLLHVGERKARAEFAELMRDLVALGRAAGLVVLAATQKPSVDSCRRRCCCRRCRRQRRCCG